jgi:transcriptional regulator with XRE-family HTH domain
LAQNIVTRRNDAGWSQEDLAHFSGVHKNTVKAIETDGSGGNQSTLQAIAGALKCSVGDLFRQPLAIVPQSESDLNELVRIFKNASPVQAKAILDIARVIAANKA